MESVLSLEITQTDRQTIIYVQFRTTFCKPLFIYWGGGGGVENICWLKLSIIEPKMRFQYAYNNM